MRAHSHRPRLAASLATPLFFVALAVSLAGPAQAQRGWGGPDRTANGWGAQGWDRASQPTSTTANEGHVEVERFLADGAAPALSHGAIAVAAAPGGTADARDEATFEAAIIDQLAKAGYDTATPAPHGGQITEVTVTRDVLLPQAPKRSPVSGAMTMGVSNRGSMMGMALNVDMTKPKTALISTRLALTIRDRASGKPLWEGRASIATRDEDSHWSQQAIATRLAAALFEHFPSATFAPTR